MLKIKDNVDLKELEKYGFEARYSQYTGEFKGVVKKLLSFDIEIREDTKKLSVYLECTPPETDGCELQILLNDIYDLIKADLVEKVDE